MRRRLRKKLSLGEFCPYFCELTVQARPDASLEAFIDDFFEHGAAANGAVFSGAADYPHGMMRGYLELGQQPGVEDRAGAVRSWIEQHPAVQACTLGAPARMA
ncbi:MAG: hypothetical protein RL071_679 [Pseudomonadota bacterium]|jgi:uncharacterized protein YggL (DUF469 family)